MSRREKPMRTIKDDEWVGIKIKGRTYKELIRSKAVMEYMTERKVNIDECLTHLLAALPKVRFGPIEEDQMEKVLGEKSAGKLKKGE